MENIKLTDKQRGVAKLLITYEKGVNVYELLKDHKQALEKLGVNTLKINSANATLASLATKELVNKEKVAYNEKIITKYTATKKLIDLLKENN